MAKEQWRIRRMDEYNFVLERKGWETWQIEGYYASLESLCLAALEKWTTGADAKALLASLQEARSHVIAMLKSGVCEIAEPPRRKLTAEHKKKLIAGRAAARVK